MRSLSEHESREFLAPYAIPLVAARLVTSAEQAVAAAAALGFPVVLKANGAALSHKSDQGLVRLGLHDAAAVQRAHAELVARAGAAADGVLVQPQLGTARELVAGLQRDAQFGPCVMFGLGGILAEAIGDVVFRVAPLQRADALAMLDEIRGAGLLGAVRGLPAVDRDRLAEVLSALGRVGLERSEVAQIDLNPLLLDGPQPLAADALVLLQD